MARSTKKYAAAAEVKDISANKNIVKLSYKGNSYIYDVTIEWNGIDYLINEKLEAREKMTDVMSADVIRVREEVADQVAALKAMKTMAAAYGFDISQPAANAKEAIQ